MKKLLNILITISIMIGFPVGAYKLLLFVNRLLPQDQAMNKCVFLQLLNGFLGLLLFVAAFALLGVVISFVVCVGMDVYKWVSKQIERIL